NLAGSHVDQKQVGSITHPLKARLRWRQAKGSPLTVIISRREEQRRQRRANHPAPVGPAAWIDEGGDVNRAKLTIMIQKAPGRACGTWPSEFPRSWRAAGSWTSEFPWSWPFTRTTFFALCRAHCWHRQHDHRREDDLTQHGPLPLPVRSRP